MPGIFGVIDLTADAARLASDRLDIVRSMAAAMRYEPEYGAEIVSSPVLGACAGWVGWPSAFRTSKPPASTPRSVLLSAGEPLLRAPREHASDDECHAIGSGACDIATQIDKHGINGLNGVNGTFAGFLMDHERRECVLFNDRYGIERIYIHTDKSRVFFSSEAKAILAVADSARAVDAAGLAEWLTCGSTIGTRSLFQKVEILAGGTALTFAPGRKTVPTRYFDRAALEQLPELSPRQFLEQFDASLAAAVNEALARPPRAAVSLTGGFDSRLIIASIDAPSNTVPCYTFGSMFRPTGDVTVARAVARACEHPHQELKLDRTFLTGVEGHLRQSVYVSDGYLGLPGSAELYLNRQARAVAPARITGNWGGELMRGVRAFKFRMPKGDFVQPSLRGLMNEAGSSFDSTAAWHPLSYTLFQQAPNQGYGRYAIERSQVLMRSPFLDANVVTALYQAPVATRTSNEIVLKVLQRRPQLASIATDLGRLGRGPGPVRFLRHAYRRALIKAEYLTSHGAPDWMAALSSRVPPLETAFLGRDKFQHFRLWTRNQLAPLVRDIVSASAQQLEPWFDTAAVARMVELHVAGRANYTEEIDKVVTIALLHQTLLDSSRKNSGSLTQPVDARHEFLVAPGAA